MANTFDLQWELLKQELDHINHAIERIDGITQGVKNWTVLTWAGSLAILLDKDHAQMRHYAWLTAAIPLLFWTSDGTWRSIQRSFILRTRLISEFANGPMLEVSRTKGTFVDFAVLDPRASMAINTEQYRSYTSLQQALAFRTVAFFYLPLCVISLGIGVWFSCTTP